MIYTLDTDIFTHAFHKKHGIPEQIVAVRAPNLVAISIITRVQVLLGRFNAVLKAASAADILRMQEQLQLSEAFLSGFPVVLPFKPTAGTLFDQFRTEKRFRKIGTADLLIACIALDYKATLVTRNVKDFSHVPNLKVENWAD